MNDQLGPNSDFKIRNLDKKGSRPKFNDLINQKENTFDNQDLNNVPQMNQIKLNQMKTNLK